MNNIGDGVQYPGPSGAIMGQYVPRHGRYIGRGGEIKVKRKCLEVVCQPPLLFLLSTICMTAFASVLLYYGLTGPYWELLTYDMEKVNEIVAANSTFLSVKWLFNGKVPAITYDNSYSSPDPPKYLLPLHSGVWISCIDLQGELL